jgi:hypothetical protein
MYRRLGLAAVSALVALSAVTPTSALTGTRYVGGVEIVGPEILQARPADEKEAIAFDDALQFAMDHPDAVGYPWIDPPTRSLQVSAVDGVVSYELGAFMQAHAAAVVRDVTHSYAELQAIADDITRLNSQDGAYSALIYRTEPDEKNNRIIVTIDKLDEALIAWLGSEYGSDAVAVRVDANAARARSLRTGDVSPFWGGAWINTPSYVCTDAFSWLNGSLWDGMLTAGHCAPYGGAISTPAQSMGYITSGTRENWDPASGTVSWPGEPGVYRGDIGLVQMYSGRASNGRIYRYGPTSGVSSPVRLTWARWSRPGDSFCTGGKTTGEICNWQVTVAGINQWYIFDGWGVWARNVVEGVASSGCTQPGDSGGSVFTLYQDGVAAKGIISGKADVLFHCYVYFTDIQNAVQSLPGGVKLH